MQPGDRVRLKSNPSREGILTSEPPIGQGARTRLVVMFSDGQEQLLASSLEKVTTEIQNSYSLMSRGQYAGASHLRGAITQARLSGKLANLIYSLNTTNTKFLPYQFKPVLQYLDSPSRGIIIADEVGLGKTIEAGLIWTELRARQDAGRLLVVCPAMLREKWCLELYNRFGVKAEMVDAAGLLDALKRIKENPAEEVALVVSMQGTRPPSGWNSIDAPSQLATAKLARFLEECVEDETLLDLVVVDEAHYLRNKNTQAHQFAHLLRPVTDGLVMLSATPIQMKSTDLFNLLHLLDQETFAHEWIYDLSVKANAPIVALRDKLQREPVTQEEFKIALKQSVALRWADDNEQIDHLLKNLPTDETLASNRGRAEYAELLDRVNPRAKVITRTLKRDVQELRVKREPVILSVEMTKTERAFYEKVTDAVREYCEDNDVLDGFLLTIPQRQMSSCMAGAYEAWTSQKTIEPPSSDEEFAVEISGEVIESLDSKGIQKSEGGLTRTLSEIAKKISNGNDLQKNDSKFAELLKNLKQYWVDYPGRKVVLFAFYRNTLHYLEKRLKENGILPAVLHGGMDKQAILDAFKDDEGPQILLSSEVASEGVDLQFSSLLINYDLPWNPAKIEQRIGRIDRIGQEAEKILIWNLVYKDTLDERVCIRLDERLKVFRATLGSMEEVLGEEVKKLTRDLLTHKLTPEAEGERLKQFDLVVEKLRIGQEQLDARASELIGHGDFIQNKAKAANELGRYIKGEDLYFYVKDYLEKEFSGSRLIVESDGEVKKCSIQFSIEAKVEFHDFLLSNKLLGRTLLLSSKPPTLWFDNQHGSMPKNVEKVTQDHPLIRFIASQQSNLTKRGYYLTSAIELSEGKAKGILKGTYVYVVSRWSFPGPRDVERLVYEACNIETGESLQSEQAELLINSAAINGNDWHAAAANVLDHVAVANLQNDCKSLIDEKFAIAIGAQERESRDRINEMNAALEKEYERKKIEYEQKRTMYTGSNKPSHKGALTRAYRNLKKLEEKYEIKKHQNHKKISGKSVQDEVSSGVIMVS